MNRLTATALISGLISAIISVAAFLVLSTEQRDNGSKIESVPLTEGEQIQVLESLMATSTVDVSEQERILESLRATSSEEMSAEREAEIIRILESLQAPR